MARIDIKYVHCVFMQVLPAAICGAHRGAPHYVKISCHLGAQARIRVKFFEKHFPASQAKMPLAIATKAWEALPTATLHFI